MKSENKIKSTVTNLDKVGNSQENSIRSLFLIRVLFIQMVHGPCY